MSDAKAKAEARRAKILARDSSKRTVSAVPAGEEDDALYANLGEIKGKDRPIAARRNLIRSTSQIDTDAIGGVTSEPTTPMGDKTEKKSDGDFDAVATNDISSTTVATEENKSASDKDDKKDAVDSAVPTETPVKSSSESSSSNVTAQSNSSISPKSSTSKLPPPKTLEEIEREVAENTAKFDRNMSFRSNNKLTPERLAQLEQLAKQKKSASVDPSNMMRLVRLLVIGLLAAYTGFRTAEISRHEALSPSKFSELQTIKEFDEFGNIVSEVPVAMGDVIKKNPAEGRTWIGYFQDQYTRRSECTISAVMLSWWVAGIFKRFVTSSQKQQKSKSNIIEQVYNYINGFQEAALATVGEFAWHLFVLVFTVMCHTLYYSNLAMQQSGSAAAGEGTCVAGSDGTCTVNAAVAGEL